MKRGRVLSRFEAELAEAEEKLGLETAADAGSYEKRAVPFSGEGAAAISVGAGRQSFEEFSRRQFAARTVSDRFPRISPWNGAPCF